VEDRIARETQENLKLQIEINKMKDEENELLQKCQTVFLNQQSGISLKNP